MGVYGAVWVPLQGPERAGEEDSAKLPWLLGKQAQNSCVRSGAVDTRACVAVSLLSCSKTETGVCSHQSVPSGGTPHSRRAGPRKAPSGLGGASSPRCARACLSGLLGSSATFLQVTGRWPFPRPGQDLHIGTKHCHLREVERHGGHCFTSSDPRGLTRGVPPPPPTAGSPRGQFRFTGTDCQVAGSPRCSCCARLSDCVSRTQNAFPP